VVREREGERERETERGCT
jgi:hypothetical protein